MHVQDGSIPLMPIDGHNEWPKYALEHVFPPVDKVMPGKHKNARNKSKGEKKKLKSGRIRREGQYQAFNKCRHRGHKKKSCNTTINNGVEKAAPTSVATAPLPLSTYFKHGGPKKHVTSGVRATKKMATRTISRALTSAINNDKTKKTKKPIVEKWTNKGTRPTQIHTRRWAKRKKESILAHKNKLQIRRKTGGEK